LTNFFSCDTLGASFKKDRLAKGKKRTLGKKEREVIKMSLLKEGQKLPLSIRIAEMVQACIQERKENNPPLESYPKRSFNVEGPSLRFWY